MHYCLVCHSALDAESRRCPCESRDLNLDSCFRRNDRKKQLTCSTIPLKKSRDKFDRILVWCKIKKIKDLFLTKKGGFMNAKLRKSFLSFLFWARRRHGYAGGAKGNVLLRGGRQFICSRGKFLYWDDIWCFNPFIGQEMVWSNESGWIWGMNYYGRMTQPSDFVYLFLRSALLRCDVYMSYRGPKSYTEGEWVYETTLEPWSNIIRFCGTEFIYRKGVIVYRGEYHGGIIKGK